MDFFQHQQEARVASRWLVVYFALAVVAIAASVYLVGTVALYWMRADELDRGFVWWSAERFVFLAGATLLVILSASLYKIWRLSEGGAAVAALLGGRPLDPNTREPGERRLQNVVEEMALASGLPVPAVYLLDREGGINAFAAGFTPQDAVIGVTRGAIDHLSRDELQGVVAHELSHVLNGDMRLNLRLMGILHGILVIALLGYYLLRVGFHGGGRRRDGASAAVPVVGLSLLVIGYVGVFFARLIKAAVSRQRELLADASAVQFTRTPSGIAGALKKIGGLTEGSSIASPHAEQASHFFFSGYREQGHRRALLGAARFDGLATHPPLRERIRRIEPSWDGAFPEIAPSTRVEPEEGSARPAGRTLSTAAAPMYLAGIGTLDEAHIAYAQALLERIPAKVREAVHEPSTARAVLLALIAARDSATRNEQLQLLATRDDEVLVWETEAMMRQLEGSPREARLPLVDLSLPALRRLSPRQYADFVAAVESFVRADRRIDLFELTLTRVLKRHLEPVFERTGPKRIAYYALHRLRGECSALLSALAHVGSRNESAARGAFERGARELPGLRLAFQPRGATGLTEVRDALVQLDAVAPKLKQDLMRAFVAAVSTDGRVTSGEGELLRAIADSLGLPMPPLLPGQAIEASAEAS